MSDRYSIAEARHNLAALVHDLERKPRIELTRRGEPVAVLLSIHEFRRLSQPKANFWEAYQHFRETVDLSDLDPDEIFAGVRDPSPGRDIAL